MTIHGEQVQSGIPKFNLLLLSIFVVMGHDDKRPSSSRKRDYSTERTSRDHAERDSDSEHHKKRRKHDDARDEDRNDDDKKHRSHKSSRKREDSDDDDDRKEKHKHRSSSKKHKEHKDRGSDDEGRHRKHKHHKKDKEKHSKKDKGKAKSKAEESSPHGMQIVDDDPDERAMWAEKDITMDGERVSVIPSIGPRIIPLIIFSLGPSNKHTNCREPQANLDCRR